MSHHGIQIDTSQTAGFCRRHGIQRLSLSGSIQRDDFRTDREVNVLVEFHPDATPTLLGIAGMEIELMQLLRRKADLRAAEDLSRYFRDRVIREAKGQYAA